MTLLTTLSDFEAEGIELWAEGGKLRFRAPAGTMDDEKKDWLRQHRGELLSHLSADDIDELEFSPRPHERFEPFPLTDVQGAYLLGRGDAFEHGDVACHAYLEVAYEASEHRALMTGERVSQAWRRLIERHDMLRAVVHSDAYQIVLPHVDVDDVPEHITTGSDNDVLASVRERLEQRVARTDQWPLIKLEVSRLSDRVVLHLSVDLLVIDHTSLQMLLGELEALVLDGTGVAAAPEVTFRDHVRFTRSKREGARAAADREYWTQRLDTLPGAPELPTAAWATSEEESGRAFVRHRFRLATDERAVLAREGARHSLTPSAALLTAYSEIIARWSRVPRFLLNIPTFTRGPFHPDIGRVVGDFTSVELLEADHTRPVAFAERARTLQAQLWDDLAHSAMTGTQVLAELARANGGQATLMPVVFTAAAEDAGLTPLRGRIDHAITQTPQVWIDCQVLADGSGLVVSWDVRQGVLPDGVVDDMFEAFERLVRRLLDDPTSWDTVTQIPLPADQSARRDRAHAEICALPEGLLHESIIRQAHRRPAAAAVIGRSGVLSFGDLVARAEAVADALRSSGAAPGDRVAVIMDKSAHQVVAVLGALLAGTVYVPIDTSSPAQRRRAVILDAGCTAVLTTERMRSAVDPGGIAVVSVDELPRSGAARSPQSTARPDDPAYVIYTSGSTGAPKGVVISHRGALNTCEDVVERFGIGEDDAVLGVAGLGFDLSVWDIFGVLGAGGRLVLPDSGHAADPRAWAEPIAAHRVTVWNSVPGQFQMLMDYATAEGAHELASLRLVLLSGDWIPVTLPDHAREHLPHAALHSLGGATEGSIWSVSHPIGSLDPRRPSVPYGTPLKNQGVRVLDAHGRDAPDWAPGEIVITGAGVALEYFGDSERTAERFPLIDGSRAYRTGDLGRWTDDGTLEFLGREDTQVKLRGYRIELAEIEAAVQSHPSVGSAAIVLDPDRRQIAGFVETVVRDDPPASPGIFDSIDHPRTPGLARFVDASDRVGIAIMRQTLAATDLGRGRALSVDEIAAALGADANGATLLRRWLRTLLDRGELVADGDRVSLVGEPAGEVPVAAWAELSSSLADAGWSHGLVDTLRLCARRMPEMLRGEADLRQTLFADPADRTLADAYGANAAADTLHAALAEALRDVAEQHDAAEPLQVLEVGGGSAGSTSTIVDALAGSGAEHTFTDPSAAFVSAARERFSGSATMRFAQFDPQRDAREQRWAANSVDVVIVPNALHNWSDASAALRRLAGILRPGGWLFVLDNTRDDNPALHVSMELMELRHGPFVDRRGETDQVFWTGEQWPQLLQDSGFQWNSVYPNDNGATGTAGQALFAARAKPGRAGVTSAVLGRWVRALLPEYMIPSQWHVLDDLPRTVNGKIDRRALTALTDRRPGETSDVDDEPMNAMEQQIAEIWGELLDVTGIGRDDDFFALGGDSLLVARFVGLLRERIPDVIALQWETVLRHMLRRPTVAHLASYLREVSRSGPREDELPTVVRSSPLVALHGPGDDPVTVLVHAGTGTAMPYRALVTEIRRRSAGSSSLAALEVPDLHGFWDAAPEGLIEQMAADYARDLVGRGIGRVHLVGYCLGGLVATEVARDLTDMGADVDSLTLISSHSPRFRLDDDILAEYSFSVMMGIPPEALGFPAEQLRVAAATDRVLAESPGVIPRGGLGALDGDFADVGAQFRALAETSPERRIEAMCRHVPASAGMYDPEHMERLLQTFRQSVFAISRYQPEPYLGDATFLRHSGAYPFPGSKDAVTSQWEDVVLGDLDIVDVAGDHFTCLSRENSPGVVSILERVTGGGVVR